jgi:hypothetical protein
MTLEAIEDSRVRGGVLTLDTLPFEKQLSECSLVPSTETDGDDLEVLSGAVLKAAESYSWVLNLGLIQDFADPDGLVEYLRANKGDEVPFSWEPNDVATHPSYTGTVKLRPTRIGGQVNTRLTDTVELPVVGEPVPDYPVIP